MGLPSHSAQSLHKHTEKAEAALGFSRTKLREILGHLQGQEFVLNPWVIGSHEGIHSASHSGTDLALDETVICVGTLQLPGVEGVVE